MNAYKVDAIVTKNGLTILEMLSLPIGSSVEVIILDKGMSNPKELLSQSDRSSPTITLESEYLVGVSSLMNEWESAADELAYQDL
jgi:hypothetical protein